MVLTHAQDTSSGFIRSSQHPHPHLLDPQPTILTCLTLAQQSNTVERRHQFQYLRSGCWNNRNRTNRNRIGRINSLSHYCHAFGSLRRPRFIIGKDFFLYAHSHVASNIDVVALLFRGIEELKRRETFPLWVEEEKLLIGIASKARDC